MIKKKNLEKMVCDVKLRFGLSLFFEYLTVFKNNPTIQYNVQFTNELIEQYREGQKEYYDYLKKYLIKECGKLQNVNFISGNNPDLAHKFPDQLRFPVLFPNEPLPNDDVDYKLFYPCDDLPINSHYKIEDNYICINTKILAGVDGNIKEKWDRVKNILFNILQEQDYKIVLLGERKPMNCREYNIHRTFSIYDDLVKFPNVIDLTSNDTVDLYKPEIINRNFYVLSKSKFNIHIGEGGGLRVYRHINNTLGFTSAILRTYENYNDRFKFDTTFDHFEFKNKLIRFFKDYSS